VIRIETIIPIARNIIGKISIDVASLTSCEANPSTNAIRIIASKILSTEDSLISLRNIK